MKKVILFIFILLNFLVCVSPVLAQTACESRLLCDPPEWIPSSRNGLCAARGVPARDDAPAPVKTITSSSCPAGTCPDSTNVDTCKCIPTDAETCPKETGVTPFAGVDPETAPAAIMEKAFSAMGEDFCTTHTKECSSGAGLKCDGGIKTAIGCVPTEPKTLVEGLLKYGTLAAGGIAFLLMLLASLEMITAEGNAETIKKAQEKFYSAIIGLLLIIFAVLLMQVIGVDILGLPGFGR